MESSERSRPSGGGSASGRAIHSWLPAPAFGLRLLALAAVAGSAAFLPATGSVPLRLAAGILCGALIGALHYLLRQRRVLVPDELFVLAQVGVWTYLVGVSGGQRSPLFLGYVLEVPLAAALLSRRGILLASASGALAYVLSGALVDPPLDRSRALLAIGFLVVTAVLAWMLTEALERQQRQIDVSQAALRGRAETLAEELRLLGDYLDGALLVLDEMGRVVSLNPAGATLLGVDHASVAGRAWQEVLRLDAEGARAMMRTLAEGEPVRGVRMLIEDSDGRPRDVQAELWASPTAHGRRVYALLGTPAASATESDPLRRLGEAVACVSHQFKNSLHALQGFASEIEHDSGGGGSECTRDLVRALRSLGQLADDVLAMSGAPRPADECVPIDEALSTAIVLARHPGTRVQVAAPSPRLLVRASRGQLVHALFNVIDNACHAGPPGAPVAVRVSEGVGTIEVEIHDEGPGLPADLERANGRAPSARGSGYGLLAARRFLEGNGGGLAFERPDGGGTLCRITLRAASHETQEA